MNNTYADLVQQTFNFPQEGFEVKENYLEFNGVDIKALIDKYGTPLKLSYLPKIGMQIKKAKKMFATAMKRHKYEGKYFYCYCTKSSHFSFIVEEALNSDIHLETSYAYDIEIIKKLIRPEKDHQGYLYYFVTDSNKNPIRAGSRPLLNCGFKNVIPILG